MTQPNVLELKMGDEISAALAFWSWFAGHKADCQVLGCVDLSGVIRAHDKGYIQGVMPHSGVPVAMVPARSHDGRPLAEMLGEESEIPRCPNMWQVVHEDGSVLCESRMPHWRHRWGIPTEPILLVEGDRLRAPVENPLDHAVDFWAKFWFVHPPMLRVTGGEDKLAVDIAKKLMYVQGSAEANLCGLGKVKLGYVTPTKMMEPGESRTVEHCFPGDYPFYCVLGVLFDDDTDSAYRVDNLRVGEYRRLYCLPVSAEMFRPDHYRVRPSLMWLPPRQNIDVTYTNVSCRTVPHPSIWMVLATSTRQEADY